MARFAVHVDVRTEVQTQKSANRAKGKLHSSWQQVKVSPLHESEICPIPVQSCHLFIYLDLDL